MVKLNYSFFKLTNLRYLRLIFIGILIVDILYEVLATYIVIKRFAIDIKSYDHDEIWRREYFKSTRNFFIFTIILSVMVNCIGLLSAHKNDRTIVVTSTLMLIMEWAFELVGLYASKDMIIVTYKFICQAVRPFVFIASILYWWILKKLSSPTSMLE